MRGFRRNAVAALFLSIALLPVPAAAWQPPAGAGRWTVEWGDRQCSLIRQSEIAPFPIFMLRTTPGTRFWEMRIVSSDWPGGTPINAARLTTTLQPGDAAVSGNAALEATTRGRALVVYRLMQPTIDALAAAQSLRISRSSGTVFELALPSMPRALAAMRQCEDEVLREWGIDPVAYRAVREPPGTNIAAVVSDRDYPRDAIRRNQQGMAVVRLAVSADGRLTDCAVVLSSGHALLDERTCHIARTRLHPTPAIGADGAPVAALAISSIRWVLPQ